MRKEVIKVSLPNELKWANKITKSIPDIFVWTPLEFEVDLKQLELYVEKRTLEEGYLWDIIRDEYWKRIKPNISINIKEYEGDIAEGTIETIQVTTSLKVVKLDKLEICEANYKAAWNDIQNLKRENYIITQELDKYKYMTFWERLKYLFKSLFN